jgi:hypothetical protein
MFSRTGSYPEEIRPRRREIAVMASLAKLFAIGCKTAALGKLINCCCGFHLIWHEQPEYPATLTI